VSIFYKKWSRVPTSHELMEFDGEPGDAANLYAYAMQTNWRCPSCHRTAHECIRWMRLNELSWRIGYRDEFMMGFTVDLRRYACRAGELNRTWRRRFDPTLLCSDCETINKSAKRKLGLPPAFNFSPEELGLFSFCLPYSGHMEIDYDLAYQLYAHHAAWFFGSVAPPVPSASSAPKPRVNRLPSPAELEAFDGDRFSREYSEAVRTGWRCPCCDRTAHECVRWEYIANPRLRKLYGDAQGRGFTAQLDLHHCHGDGMGSLAWRRFPKTLICHDCNIADGKVKFRLNLPGNFSFSPDEIKQFIRCVPHSNRPALDLTAARRIYASVETEFARLSSRPAMYMGRRVYDPVD
jgi:hypothetical protein